MPSGVYETKIELGTFFVGKNVFIPVYVDPLSTGITPIMPATWGYIKALYGSN